MTRFFKSFAGLCSAALLVACAPAARVILLPEGGGKTSAVEVKTALGSQVLAAPYQTAEVGKNGQVALTATDPLVVMDRYGAMMARLPPAQEQFLLYFEPGGAQLTASSQAQLPAILERARARKGGEIIVTGHTDRVGAVEANDALSLQRARTIRQLLVGQGFHAELVEAIGRGERAPLVPTADEVVEPQNRRAEIVVR
jgi:outer membrane protein OmpA-like peptidoglycan-associated protein